VKVLDVDVARKRISLTMKLDAKGVPRRDGPRDNRFEVAGRGQRPPANAQLGTAMAGAFARLQQVRK